MMDALKLSEIHLLHDFSGAWRIEAKIGAEQVKPLQLFLEKVREKFVSAKLEIWREKRSLDANAYCWKLLSLIADELTIRGAATTKDEIYLAMLKRYGQGDIVKVRPDKAELILREFPYYEKHEKIYNDENQYYRVWVGSSNYNSHEMYIFIEGIIAEARDLGIETLPPDEVKRLTDSYRPKRTGGDD